MPFDIKFLWHTFTNFSKSFLSGKPTLWVPRLVSPIHSVFYSNLNFYLIISLKISLINFYYKNSLNALQTPVFLISWQNLLLLTIFSFKYLFHPCFLGKFSLSMHTVHLWPPAHNLLCEFLFVMHLMRLHILKDSIF